MDFISYSQIGQDTFVYDQLVKPFNNLLGTFLDIGCSDGVAINNTLALERLGWRGLLVDIDPEAIKKCKINRTSPAILGDAMTMDWSAVCEEYCLGKSIDYLSLDIDDLAIPGTDWAVHAPRWAAMVLSVLENLLASGFSFHAITCEHNGYLDGGEGKAAMQELLKANSYRLFAEGTYPPSGWSQDDFWLKL
jgi:SAM-dependent methyltransferase